MSINSLKILNKILTAFIKKSVSEVEDSVRSGNSSDDNRSDNKREPKPVTQFDTMETAVAEADSSLRLSSQALLSAFRKTECCTLDGLNEYDDDFTSFAPLGDLVTHEMKQAADRLIKQTVQNPDDKNSQSLVADEITAHNHSDESQQT